MLQTFACPNCHAALEYETGSRAVTVRCAYCSSTVIVPEKLRQADGRFARGDRPEMMAEVLRLINAGRKIEAIKLFRETADVSLKEAKGTVETLAAQDVVWLEETAVSITTDPFPTDSRQPSRRRTPLLLGIVVLLVGIGLAAAVVMSSGTAPATVTENEEISTDGERGIGAMVTQVAELALNATATPNFADTILEFGGAEGVGPGFFNDTRRLAVDAAGNIYTGDYSGGRIQVFTAEGEFLNQFVVDPELYMVAMTVDREGTVYVAVRDEVRRYSGQTGELLDALSFGDNVRTMAAGPDGSIVLVTRDGNLIRLDGQGAVDLEIPDALDAIPDFAATRDDVAVDGTGRIYLLGNESVFVLDVNGRYLNRFGSQGDDPDQFRSLPTALTVDGQGRVFVADFGGVKMFDSDGRFLTTIEFSGVTFDMVVNNKNHLLLMDRNGNRVLAYRFNQ